MNQELSVDDAAGNASETRNEIGMASLVERVNDSTSQATEALDDALVFIAESNERLAAATEAARRQ